MASAWLARQYTTGNQRTFTISCWVKRGSLGTRPIVSYAATVGSGGSGARGNLSFDSDLLYFQFNPTGSSWWTYYVNTRLFRDTNAWYHIVIRVDTTDATASNRLKIYVNGEQQTLNSTIGTQNLDTGWNANNIYHHIGRYASSTSITSTNTWDGGIAHFHYVDGTAYDASTFGETDSTTGIWKPKTAPSVTYGTNGFFLKFENSASMGTDSSGQSNNLTVNGTMTQLLDTPSNVFATLNPLSTHSTLSHGNTEAEKSSVNQNYETSTTTLGITSGKYYCECKITIDQNAPAFGISATNANASTTLGSEWLGGTSDTYGYWVDGTIYNNGSSVASGQSTFSTNDIMGMALDLDSTQNTLKYYKNGSLVYTVNVTTNSNGWFFATTHQNGKSGARSKFNFGNGYFRTDAVSSAQNPDDGIGIFEYDVPAGYRALCTKSINAEEYS